VIKYSNTIDYNNTQQVTCQVPSMGERSEPVSGTYDFDRCSTGDCAGRSCRKCRLGVYDSPFTCLNGVQSAENIKHRIDRFYIRAFRGAVCGSLKGYRFRWFVLTESDEALGLGIDFGSEFHRFITWLRYRCSDFQYLVVEHIQGDKKRRNWHVLSYGSDRLPVLAMRDYWLRHYKSTVTGMAQVKDIGKSIKYLAGYLSGSDKFNGSWCSQGWVFRGWVGMTKDFYRRYGHYPSDADLATLALMSAGQRGGGVEFLLETGYPSMAVLQASQAKPGASCSTGRLDGRSIRSIIDLWGSEKLPLT